MSVVFFLTSEYVCVSGCNSFDLDDARLCSLADKKMKVDVTFIILIHLKMYQGAIDGGLRWS